MYGTMIDCTGSNLPGLLAALGGHYPTTLAGYVTGSDGIDWPAQYWTSLAGKTGLFRYDQSASLSLFGSGGSDGADVERGAGTIAAATAQTIRREARGWYSWWYLSVSALAPARGEATKAGFKRLQFIVANWNDSEAEAEQFIADNHDIACVQWASPSSNPATIVPGTARTVAELNVDLNVTIPGWFVAHPNPAPPVPPVSNTTLAALVTPSLTARIVSSKDSGKTWT